jgi:transcriptional regulator with XRE-family HTH domain
MMTKSVEKLIGAQIAKIRNDREITQERLAELTNVTPETISRLERGVSIPSIKTLEKISQALHTSLKDIFDFEYLEEPDKSDAVENEIARLIASLKTKKANDIKMCYHLLKTIFEQIEKSYSPKQ